jgi:hypothetical protein
MTPKEAADKLRPEFHLELMPADERHHVKFVEAVATELGVEHTHFNLAQVANALDKHEIDADSNEYPKMLFSRTHHTEDGVAASIYDKRHDAVWVHVASEDEAKKLGSGFVDDLGKLPPRGDLPLHAPVKVKAEASVEA